jgi:D-threo-aldose 1-dehydrogenase
MRQVTLPGTEVSTSVIGYGCGGLMARMRRPESVRCLEVALEAGITHFDVARSYGYGEAEGAVGSFLRGRRDRVTVTTKLGIAPPRRSAALAVGKEVARGILALAPPLRKWARDRAAGLASGGHFGVADARVSLETSLRELGTEYVDVLLLHECRPEDLARDELLAFLRDRVREGTVRAFGVATDPESTRRIVDERGEYANVVQLPRSVLLPAPAVLPAAGRAVFSHSVLAEALDAVHAHVTASAERTRTWSEAVGADCSQRDVLAGLMLAEASWAGPGTVALFSSRTADHIRANAERADSVTADQVRALADLVAREVRPAAVSAARPVQGGSPDGPRGGGRAPRS